MPSTNEAHLATTGYVVPSPNHVQYNVSKIIMYLNVATLVFGVCIACYVFELSISVERGGRLGTSLVETTRVVSFREWIRWNS